MQMAPRGAIIPHISVPGAIAQLPGRIHPSVTLVKGKIRIRIYSRGERPLFRKGSQGVRFLRRRPYPRALGMVASQLSMADVDRRCLHRYVAANSFALILRLRGAYVTKPRAAAGFVSELAKFLKNFNSLA
jgi:hypothetical protein